MRKLSRRGSASLSARSPCLNEACLLGRARLPRDSRNPSPAQRRGRRRKAIKIAASHFRNNSVRRCPLPKRLSALRGRKSRPPRSHGRRFSIAGQWRSGTAKDCSASIRCISVVDWGVEGNVRAVDDLPRSTSHDDRHRGFVSPGEHLRRTKSLDARFKRNGPRTLQRHLEGVVSAAYEASNSFLFPGASPATWIFWAKTPRRIHTWFDSSRIAAGP